MGRVPLGLNLLRLAGRAFPAGFRDAFYRKVLDPDRPSGRAVETVVRFGEGRIHVRTDSFIEWSLFMHGRYEEDVARVIRERVRPGMTCLDIGANVGACSLLMAWACAPGGRVLAFEPRADLFARLGANRDLNGLAHLELHPYALSDADGEATLYAEEERDCNKGKASLARMPRLGAVRGIGVRKRNAATDPALASLDRCGFVKIDTEGHDAIVLRALRGFLARTGPAVLLEYSPEHWGGHGSTLDDALGILGSLGYGARAILPGGEEFELGGGRRPEGACNLLAQPLGAGRGAR